MFAYRLLVLVSLILVVTILTLTETEAERAKSDLFKYRRNRQTNPELRQYCGRTLSGTVRTVCKSAYNTRFKKSIQEMDNYLLSNDAYPYKTVENAKKMLKTRRNPRGIYEECCLKSCTTEELKTYCANP